MESMIEVRDLRKFYGPFQAVRGVTFDVERGEIVGFLGPNGAGKTTTLRILTCTLSATAGSARIMGLDVLDASIEVRRRIGYLPENAPLYGDMTVKESLDFVAAVRGIRGQRLRERRDFVVAACGLAPKYRSLVKTLSKGYRQRVGLAQAILHEPEILILDEPTIGLDPNQIIEVREIIRDIGRERTVLLSSHILSEVEATCTRVIIIHQGQIVANDAPSALEAQLGDADAWTITADAPAPDLLGVVAGVGGVEDARLLPGTDGTASVAFRGAGGRVTDPVWSAVSARGFPVLELSRRRATLEDIFRKLTAESAAGKGA